MNFWNSLTPHLKLGYYHFMKKVFLPVLLVAVIIALGIFLYLNSRKPQNQSPVVSSFEECQDAGYPIQESYPPRCRTADGQVFTQDIGNELEKMDLIRIENPRPNQKITSPLRVAGEARGTWYFEATFPIKLVDNNGNVISENFSQAQGEWMSEEFVPFEGKLIFTTDKSEGKLILERSNPSGLSENADQLEIPVQF